MKRILTVLILVAGAMSSHSQDTPSQDQKSKAIAEFFKSAELAKKTGDREDYLNSCAIAINPVVLDYLKGLDMDKTKEFFGLCTSMLEAKRVEREQRAAARKAADEAVSQQ